VQNGNDVGEFARNILIVIVIYRMNIDEAPAWTSLHRGTDQGQTVDILLYDNSPNAQRVPVAGQDRIQYRHDPSNPGVSKAYNEGLQLAISQGKSWLLLLDQDTTLPADLLDIFMNAVEKNPDLKIFVPALRDRIGLVSPFRHWLGKGVRLQSISSGVHSLRSRRFVNSGLLVSTSLFKTAAGYDERFPMDFTDLSFIERVKPHTQKFFLVPAECRHDLSSGDNSGKNVEEAIIRFRTLCIAARLYKKEISKAASLTGILLPRAIKLFLAFRDFRFIKLALSKRPV
jgi:GT2 family glycosyltransferase